MNFNSDYQSNQNRLQSSEAVNLSLNATKTKTKFKAKQRHVIRILCEILFVLVAVGIGYMQGLKSFSAYTDMWITGLYNNLQKPFLKITMK